jgi:molybdopterin-guanine dinucleotide biosynthesis protein A
MKCLGAIFAGGQARRFGSDKAAARYGGMALIDHVAAHLRPQVDTLVVVGRAWKDLVGVEDRPVPGLGPLGALAGALVHAEAHGFDTVLTSGCDLPDLPDDLVRLLSPAPAVIAGQPLIGLWPAALARDLVAYLEADGNRALRSWIAGASARRVSIGRALPNINTPEDLEALISPAADQRSSR